MQLMLLDLMLPEMDGLQVLQRMRSQPRLARLPVIIVTGAYSPEQEIAGLEAGADDVIAKPFSTPQLLARVRTLLRARHAEEALGRAEALSHLLIEGMRDMVFVADERGHFTYVSPSAENAHRLHARRDDLRANHSRMAHSSRRPRARARADASGAGRPGRRDRVAHDPQRRHAAVGRHQRRAAARRAPDCKASCAM